MNPSRHLLATKRLGFRRYEQADVAALVEVFADPYAAKFYPGMATPEGWQKWIDWNLMNYERDGLGLWALELLEDGRFVGDAGLTWQQVEGVPMLEIGYHIHAALRGRGLASEAAQACLDHGFSRPDVDFICSIVHPANVASVKVSQRVHASMRTFEGRSGPTLLFSTRRDQWRAP
jgi:ribosomal-protein-alanine N-acetyltransferase